MKDLVIYVVNSIRGLVNNLLYWKKSIEQFFENHKFLSYKAPLKTLSTPIKTLVQKCH